MKKFKNKKSKMKNYNLNFKKEVSLYFTFLIFIFEFIVHAPAAFSLDIPEKLTYDLKWAGIKTGDASLELKDNGSHIQIISKATSAKWVSIFYRVDDSIFSTLKKGRSAGFENRFFGTPYAYRVKLREGKYRRDKESVFDYSAKKVTYINHLENEKAVFDITGSTFDPLSSFYYLRGLPLETGKSVFIDVFDTKKFYKVEVQVLKKETIETSLGTVNTILIKPVMKSEGLFNRKGDILIWLTDDEKRTPVMLKTKVAVGSVKATLVSRSP